MAIRRIVHEELSPLCRGLQKDVDTIIKKLTKLEKLQDQPEYAFLRLCSAYLFLLSWSHPCIELAFRVVAERILRRNVRIASQLIVSCIAIPPVSLYVFVSRIRKPPSVESLWPCGRIGITCPWRNQTQNCSICGILIKTQRVLIIVFHDLQTRGGIQGKVIASTIFEDMETVKPILTIGKMAHKTYKALAARYHIAENIQFNLLFAESYSLNRIAAARRIVVAQRLTIGIFVRKVIGRSKVSQIHQIFRYVYRAEESQQKYNNCDDCKCNDQFES